MKQSTDELAVAAVLDRWAAAIHAKNAEAAMLCYSEDVSAFGLAPPLRETVSSEGLTEWFATWSGAIELQMTERMIRVSANIALVTSIDLMRGQKADGTAASLWVRSTRGMARVQGEWKVQHEHTSVPFYMDGSYRAAVDLEP